MYIEVSTISMVGTGIMNLPMPIALPELLAHMPDGLVVLDQRGVVMVCNDAACHLLATPQRDWNGREFLDVIAGSPLEIDLHALLARPIATATRHLIYERADGMRAVELRLRPLYADDPGAGARLVVEEPLTTASPLEGHAVTEYDVTQLQHILRAGQPRVISVADPELAWTPAQAILQHEGVRTVVVVPLASLAAPLGAMFVGHADQRTIAPNELQLFASVGEIVSEAIARTRHAEEIQEASRAKSTLLATVSHELRTPLSSIVGFTDMLEQGIFGELPERMHEPLARMRHSSLALLRLTNDILDFSKMAAGHLTIDLEPVDLAPVIRDVVGALQPQIQERRLAVIVAIAPNLPQVQANRARLVQVLTNLIANAIKFTERGSITVRAMDDGERVRFSVADTGIGIAPEQQRILFQEFRQIENEHTRRHSGTGLGLAISQQLMQLMGGTLTVESTPGAGSTFYGEVPIVPKNLQEKEQGVTSR